MKKTRFEIYPYVVIAKRNEFYGQRCRDITRDKRESLHLGDKFKVIVEMEESGEVLIFPRGSVKNDKLGRMFDLSPLYEGENLKVKMLEILKEGPLRERDFFKRVAPISCGRSESNKALSELKKAGLVCVGEGYIKDSR